MNDSKSGHFLPLKNSKLLQMPENLLGRAIADAVPLAGHALHYAGVLEPSRPRRVLVLPAHIGMQHGLRALRHPLQQPVEQELLLLKRV